MLALAIAILSTTSFSLIMRHTQRANHDQLAVMTTNYAVASLLGFAFAYHSGQLQPSLPTLQIGIIGGLIFVTTYIFFMLSMDLKGVAIANAVTRLSVLIPVLASILIWLERPRPIESVGAILALVAMPMLSLDKGVNHTHFSRRQVLLLAGLFVTNGFCLLTSKWFHTTGLVAERPLYFALLFGTAAVAGVILWLIWGKSWGRWELGWGAALGTVNIMTSAMIILALDTLPGTIVFPVLAALGLALTTGFAAWAWREIPGRLGQVGIAVAVFAVVLINL